MTLKKSSRSGNDINNYFFFKKNKNKSIYRIKKSIYPDNISHLPIFLSCSRIIQTREKKTEKEIQFHPWISTVISIRENNIEKRIIVRLVKQELYTIVRIGSKRFERNQVDLIADKEEQKGRKKIMENSWIREIDESSLDSRRAPLLFLFFFFFSFLVWNYNYIIHRLKLCRWFTPVWIAKFGWKRNDKDWKGKWWREQSAVVERKEA